MRGRIGMRQLVATLAACCAIAAAQETLAPVTTDTVPKTLEELWAGFDPRAEPLDVEILQEFEEDGVVMKVVRFRIGIFKGQKAMMAAAYGYPKEARSGERGARKVPGLVQAHGGGQSAHYNTCLTNAKRGYATISLAWAGRLDAPGYTVGGGDVKLFWEGKTDAPDYKVTTDWGALDGYHAPSRYGRKFGGVNPDEHTIDPVESPRNSGWFLCTLGARRALTFLEQQPEVDGERLGVYGHSMGGQISSYAAGSDPRVKAAAPSCGGISYRGSDNVSEEIGWGNAPYLRNTTCPIIFLSPANDFHGRISSLPLAVSEIRSRDWRVTCAPHHNHQDTAPYEVATQLWFDQHLKGTFQWPATPRTEVKLNTASGVPSITVRPDTSKSILSLRVFYAQQGALADRGKEHLNNIHRFWRSAKVLKQGDVWTANLPVFSTDPPSPEAPARHSRPLWVYANVHYPLAEPVRGVGYYYGHYTAKTFNVSSVVEIFEPSDLQAAGVKPTITPSTVIEDFHGDWEREWFTYNRKPNVWELKTNRLYDPMYQAPDYAKLAFGMSSRQAGTLTISVDGHSASFELDGKGEWQDVVLLPLDLVNKDGDGRLDWKGLHGMGLVFRPAGAEDATAPQLRNLRWVKGTREELNARRKVRLDEAEVVDGKTYLDIKYADRVRQDIQTNMNVSFGGQPLAIGEKTYERGIGTHANSEILFFLKGKYKRFHAEVGVQKPLPASIRFTVLADGKVVFESGMMKREHGPKAVDLDMTGVVELELVVDDGGNGKHADHANWADAYVTKEAASTQSSRMISPQDYSYAYWKNGWRKHAEDRSPDILCFESGYYGFMLDIAELNKPKFGRFEDDSNVLSCLESGTARMDALPAAKLEIALEHGGTTYRLVGCQAAGQKADLSTVRMMEAGQVAQHFELQHLVFEDDADNKLGCYGDLDLVAWPNSLTFSLKLAPDYLYVDGPAAGIVGEGLCVVDKPVDIPHADEMDPDVFTMEFWLKVPKTLQSGNRGNWLLCKNLHNWQDGNIGFRYWGRSISAVMNIGGGPENYHNLEVGRQLKDSWNHLAFSYDGKDMKAYLNGRHTATKTIGKKRTPGRGFLRIGQRGDQNDNPVKGLYDQIRIWNRPLNDAELKAHARKPGVLPSREGLVLEESFDAPGAVNAGGWRNARMKISFRTTDQHWQAEQQVPGDWKMLERRTMSLDCNLTDAARDTVSIQVTTPAGQSFPVAYDTSLNCLSATVKELKRAQDFGRDGVRKYDDFFIDVKNTGKTKRTVPFLLNFRDGMGITGNVPILCDATGVPTGIPVQSSKNWHDGAYKLPYVLLPAEPGDTRYLLRYAYGFYGTLPSASHAQLSLAGYGGNGRWDQLAIGCWGETICFDIGMSLTDRAITDIRGLMLRKGLTGNKWGWTDAGHGGDWLVAADSKGKKLLFNDLKTAYLSHGPCLTDVRYAGYYGAGREAALKAQVQTLRTDDYARTFQNLEYQFRKPVAAAGASFYSLSHKSITSKVVYGNRDGLIAELAVPGDAQEGDMLAEQVTLAGESPWWIAYPGATTGHDGATGYRSLIIRAYEASFGGKKVAAPTIGLPLGKVNDNVGIGFRLTPPQGVRTLEPGDSVALDMQLITLPRIADDYYGDNQAFIQHLRENPSSWKTVYREAKGNDLEVAVSGGTLLRNYPVMIQTLSETVTVDIKGGVGYVPIRFESLASKDYSLYELKRGKEVLLDQSIHGNDYWQTDYDAASNSYKMTLNLPLDGKPASTWTLKRQAKLTIIKALYGVKADPARQVDLRAALQQMADNNINMIVADNSLAGTDPAPRIRKSLELEFTRNGKRISKSIPEGHKIDFGTGTGSTHKTYRDVAYDIHERTKLNFWQAKGEGPRPLVVIIHGGGWLGRDKSGVKDVTKYLSKGISVAAINYRYSSIAPLPAPVHDAARAIQFLRYKALDWSIDKNRIVLSGDSAGGCTSVWIACRDDLAKPDSEDPVERESTRIQGAAGAGAQISVDPKQLEAWVGPYARHGMICAAVGETSMEEALKNYAKHEATFKEFSAIHHLSQDDPPIFLAYDADLPVPAKSYGHAIHHGLFGVKFQEKSKAVEHNNVHLAIGKAYTSAYANPFDFITRTLTADWRTTNEHK